jgi:hypothetical protein
LFIKFHDDVTLFNVAGGSFAKDKIYNTGQHIGFSIRNVANRKEAIEKFNVFYVVVDHTPRKDPNPETCDATGAQ